MPANLELVEAVLLGHALVARAAASRGVRALAIKGPVTEHFRLRSPRQSVDVDYLVEPGRFDTVQEVLEESGWRPQVVSAPRLLAQHSVTLRHEKWPCEIDLHHWFPGFFVEPQVLFDQLWQRRVALPIAGYDCDAVDRVGTAAITALHFLRDAGRRSDDLEDLVQRLSTTITDEERADLVALAGATGSADTLGPLLDRLAIDRPASQVSVNDLAAWNLRSTTVDPRSIQWVNAFATTPVYGWPRLLWRAVVHTEEEIRKDDPDIAEGWRGLLVGRIRRLKRGIQSLPSAIARVRKARRPSL